MVCRFELLLVLIGCDDRFEVLVEVRTSYKVPMWLIKDLAAG